MENVTNGINNVGKPLKDQEFDLRFTYGELLTIKALSQNVAPEYVDGPMYDHFEKFYYKFKAIVDAVEDSARH
jgi:hypothetical protein